MKLLIITQKVDVNDPVLGFFHGWILEFKKHVEKLTVICLEKGASELLPDVRVLSLGKESGASRARRTLNLYRYAWNERANYNAVFVHMNQEYVLLAGILWRLMGKKVVLWRNHATGNILTDIAVVLSHVSFCTSPFAYIKNSKKTVMSPAGIDTDLFARPQSGAIAPKPRSLLSLGRISPVKSIETAIGAAKILANGHSQGGQSSQGTDFTLDIIGDALPKHAAYFEGLKRSAESMSGKVRFSNGIPNRMAPAAYAAHEISLNMTNSGSLDKTILEAMASETLVLVSNRSFAGVLPPDFIFNEGDASDLAKKISAIFAMSAGEKDAHRGAFREFAMKSHSLRATASVVVAEIERVLA